MIKTVEIDGEKVKVYIQFVSASTKRNMHYLILPASYPNCSCKYGTLLAKNDFDRSHKATTAQHMH